MITAVDLLAVIAILVWRLLFGTRTRSTVDEEPQPEPDPSVDRARAIVGWAQGSRLDWDRHVRPVLARELSELLSARRGPAANESLLGADVWPWVDPHAPFSTDLDQPGPGRDGLAQVLDRLERL
jgi:hypothetical protein